MKNYFAMYMNDNYILSPFQIIGIICLLIAFFLIIILIKNHNSENIDIPVKPLNLFDKIMIVSSLIIIVACIFTSVFVIQITRVESGSMEPTLMTGDYCVINKFAYKNHAPNRGDIVCFISSEYNVYLLKRIIGIPGDMIEFHDGIVYINGSKYDESAYLADNIKTFSNNSFIVPEDTYFMLGDNREYSTDSRFFNAPYIPISDIQGEMVFHWKWSLDQ